MTAGRVAVEDQRAFIADRAAAQGAMRAAIADLQCRAGGDRRAAAIGVVAGDRYLSTALLRHRAGAADHTTIDQRVHTVEHQRGAGAVEEDTAGDAARRTAIAEMHLAGIDRHRAAPRFKRKSIPSSSIMRLDVSREAE